MTKNKAQKAKPKVIVILGPTASGKSDLGIKLAKKIKGEIISADSRQVYTGLDFGTGKVPKDPSRNFQFPISNFQSNSKSKTSKKDYYSSGIRHHLIDITGPKKQFTADDFKKLGEKALKEITGKGKVPIIVGGTGFYIDILLGRMQTAEVKPDARLRAKFEKQSAEQLFEQLTALDPERAKNIDRHNKRRLIRALEIVIKTGKPVLKAVQDARYRVLWLGINPKNLHDRIKGRLNDRLEQGMIREVLELRRQGMSWKRLDEFGLEYRQISRWLRNSKFKIQNSKQSPRIRISEDQIKEFKDSPYYEILTREIIKYSKRQMTWFKKNKEINWIKNYKTAERLVRRFLS